MRAIRGIRRSRVGISESIATVLLIVAAIVIATVVWAFANSTINMQQTSADFAITSAEVRYMSTGGLCRVFVTVRNNGGQTFRSIELEISGPNLSSPQRIYSDTIDLLPGRSYSTPSTVSVSCGTYGWTAGTSVLLSVVLKTSSTPEVTIRKNVNVMVQFGA
jgi:uncharacterized protein (TIGR02588 family)